jgi:hypothetical protein
VVAVVVMGRWLWRWWWGGVFFSCSLMFLSRSESAMCICFEFVR